MPDLLKRISSPRIAGILYLLITILYFTEPYFTFTRIICILAYILLTVSLMMFGYRMGSYDRPLGYILLAGLALLSLLSLLTFFRGFRYFFYGAWVQGLLSLILNLLSLAAPVMLLLLAISCMTPFLASANKIFSRLWFLPAILNFVGKFQSIYHGLSFMSFLWLFIPLAGIFFMGLWLASLSGRDAQENSGSRPANRERASTENTVPTDTAYCGMVKHILLLLLTCGVWLYIWIYRTTRYLNQVEDEPAQTPANQLLLCLFVPFYFLYWVYKNGKRLDTLANRKGVSSDLATLCLILAIFVGIIPPILMQDKINAIITQENRGAPAAPQPVPASIPAPQTTPAPSTPPNMAEELKTCKELLDSGLISQEDYDAKKKQLLGL